MRKYIDIDVILALVALINVWVFAVITGLFFPNEWVKEWYGFPWILTVMLSIIISLHVAYNYLKDK